MIGTCPVCGQPYEYKRKEDVAATGLPSLCDDAEACKSQKEGGERTVYVHLQGGAGGHDFLLPASMTIGADLVEEAEVRDNGSVYLSLTREGSLWMAEGFGANGGGGQ